MTALTFVFFTTLVAIVSWLKTKNDDQSSTEGYFLAGRSLSWFVVGGSLLLTNLSTEQLVGLNGGAFQNGMLVMAWEVWSSLSIVAMAIVFLPRYLKSGITTVPQFLELRYGQTVRTFTSVMFLAAIIVVVLPFVLYSGSIFMIDVFGVSKLTGWEGDAGKTKNLLLVASMLAGIGGCYAILGGLKAVAVSDTINGIGLVIGGLMVPALGLMFVGDGSLTAGLTTISETYPERLSSLGDADSDIPWATLLTGMTLITTYYWCTNQGIVQRTFASKSLAEGQKGVLFAAVMKLAGPLYLVLPGIIAWHIAKTGDVQPENANNAYGFLVNQVMPTWAKGFFAATIFGAILSSFNSFLNSATTLLSMDLYKGVVNKSAEQKKVVQVGKVFGTLIIPLSVYLTYLLAGDAEKGGIFNTMKQYAAVIQIPLLTIIFVGFVSKRAPSIAAIVGLAVGMGFQFVVGVLLGNTVAGTEYHWLHVLFFNFLLMVAVMTAIRFLAPRDQPYEQKYTEDVEITPWKLAKPVGFAIVVCIAAMYYGLWNKYGIIEGKRMKADFAEIYPEPLDAMIEESDDAGNDC
ncbi:solute:sodium symporter family transporter [bacterium]|nr:solute:sodium symporter family transporter [bacterium]